MADQPRPIHSRLIDGHPYDFGTHANDFLIRREDARATEVFLVRVPGRGGVPPHVHGDMEQTFVFTSGVGVAVLTHGKERREFTCRPGDVAFVPAGWEHTVTSCSLEGVTYVTVNAFVSEVDREGDTALEHADAADTGFRTRQKPSAAQAITTVDLHRVAEARFRLTGGRARGEDYTAFDATLLDDPNTYRVNGVGPFEYVEMVRPGLRSLSLDVGDRIAAAASSSLPLFVEGSQSPLSVKLPSAGADVDVLVAVGSREDLATAQDIVEELRRFQAEVPAPLAVGIVHEGWLRLPNFYSAVRLGAESPDRRWWLASHQEQQTEVVRRIGHALEFLGDQEALERLLHESVSWLGADPTAIREWRITPRWVGFEALESSSR